MGRRTEIIPLESGFVVKAWAATAAEAAAIQSAALAVPHPDAFKPAAPFDPPESFPPNCEFGQDYAHSGLVLANAQHEAAGDGEGCTSGACLITRGAND